MWLVGRGDLSKGLVLPLSKGVVGKQVSKGVVTLLSNGMTISKGVTISKGKSKTSLLSS